MVVKCFAGSDVVFCYSAWLYPQPEYSSVGSEDGLNVIYRLVEIGFVYRHFFVIRGIGVES